MNDIIPILTKNSRNKISQIDQLPNRNYIKPNLHPNLKKLLDTMLASFLTELRMELQAPADISILRTIFIDFDKKCNQVIDSKFQLNVKKMDCVLSVSLKTLKGTINLNFLFDNFKKSDKIITNIILAVHTFSHTFPYNYDKLTINICLDDNCRHVKIPYDNQSFSDLQKNSAAFNVSGVTNRIEKIIILTKTEEIIKLLYHEMVHYIGLDNELLGLETNFNLDISNEYLLPSEAYAEFLAVILHCAYQLIQSFTDKTIIYAWYHKILFTEIKHSFWLSANILKFYGYDHATYRNFFKVGDNKHSCPILIWEYVLLRTQLLLNLDTVANLVGDNWRITQGEDIVAVMQIDNNFVNELSFYMLHTKEHYSLSYLAVDVDWQLL